MMVASNNKMKVVIYTSTGSYFMVENKKNDNNKP